MSYSNYNKAFKQLKVKPAILKKYKKHNAPKVRSCGRAKRRCSICDRIRGHIDKYKLDLCRHCFRDYATSIGFKQYS